MGSVSRPPTRKPCGSRSVKHAAACISLPSTARSLPRVCVPAETIRPSPEGDGRPLVTSPLGVKAVLHVAPPSGDFFPKPGRWVGGLRDQCPGRSRQPWVRNVLLRPWYPGRHARAGVSAAPSQADQECARERRLELLVRVYGVAPSSAEVRYRPASKSVGPTPHQAHAGESETASGPAAY